MDRELSREALYWTFDLQRFAEDDERTEDPTPRRREEARERGQFAKTAELGTALILLAGAFALYRGIGETLGGMQHLLRQGLSGTLLTMDFTIGGVTALFQHLTWYVARLVLPVALAAALAGLVSQMVQVGFVFTGYPLQPKLERINPLAGLQRIFSRRALVELAKALAKVVIIGAVAYAALRGNVAMLPRLVYATPDGVAGWVGATTWRMALTTGIALLLIALLDYGYQRAEFERSLKMSRREIKEELRQSEGDPLVRRRLREQQRRWATQRMMQQVPTADVVVTNPVHIAVALRYDMHTMDAPVVVAKGTGHLAERIRQVAEEHGVVTVENVALARALYEAVDVGQAIPEKLYQAVAEVLAFVYRLRRSGLAPAAHRGVDER